LLSEQGLPNSACVESSPWPITPPVVELLKDKRMVIIDGAHRIYNALFTLNCSEMRVVVVENLHSNLPASLFSDWRGVQIVTQNKPRHERYENFNESAFRPIRDAFKILGQS